MTSGDLAERLRAPEPTFGILSTVSAERRAGESLLDVARRILAFEALLEAEGVQKVAAKILGISDRRFNYILADLGWRHQDQRARRP